MKAVLVPIYIDCIDQNEFNEKLLLVKNLLAGEAEFLEPVTLGNDVPKADAAVFPVLVGEVYKKVEDIKKINMPLLVATSEIATMMMWDWEIVTFLKAEGLNVMAPYNTEHTKTICRAFAVKKEMKQLKFLVYQDNPGDGAQAEIFKRFYWWEDECTNSIKDKFGITIEKKSYKKLAQGAKLISDVEARKVLSEKSFPVSCVSDSSLLSAIKMYIAFSKDIAGDKTIKGIGANCLNESYFSDTTPCLAWNLLFEEQDMVYACEADTMSLVTQYMMYKSLKVPVITSNVYPFLFGMVALKHEQLKEFPKVENPDDHLLIVHCGYFGLAPQSFCSKWKFKPKVLAIVDDNATAVDAELPVGDITLTKIHPTFERLFTEEGILEKYVGFEDSHCLNGGLVKVDNGHELIKKSYSHHACVIIGKKNAEIELIANIFNITID